MSLGPEVLMSVANFPFGGLVFNYFRLLEISLLPTQNLSRQLLSQTKFLWLCSMKRDFSSGAVERVLREKEKTEKRASKEV